jgi:hypothetical protein
MKGRYITELDINLTDAITGKGKTGSLFHSRETNQ